MGPPASTKHFHRTASVISKHSKADVLKNVIWMAVGVGATLLFILMIVIIFIVKRCRTNISKTNQEMIESKR